MLALQYRVVGSSTGVVTVDGLKLRRGSALNCVSHGRRLREVSKPARNEEKERRETGSVAEQANCTAKCSAVQCKRAAHALHAERILLPNGELIVLPSVAARVPLRQRSV